ncbi:MAG: prepilin-type N-terminal cleavage/methylation domain-containing protein [Candidatus Moraniibacteriota bacterium]
MYQFNDLMKMLKNNKKFKKAKAFTLVELIISMGIFTIVIAGTSGVFVNAFKSYKGAKNLNENIKNGQFALNVMSKTFRTSAVVSPITINPTNVLSISVCDYSQGSCFQYSFENSALVRRTAGANFNPTSNICTCNPFNGAAITMTTGVVSGNFRVLASAGNETTSASTRVGKVTATMNITNGAGTATSTRSILQSTSSLRDYAVSNVGIDPNN